MHSTCGPCHRRPRDLERRPRERDLRRSGSRSRSWLLRELPDVLSVPKSRCGAARKGSGSLSPRWSLTIMVMTVAEGLPDVSSRRSISKRSSLAEVGREQMKPVSLFLASWSSLYFSIRRCTSFGGLTFPTNVPSCIWRIFAINKPAGLLAPSSSSQSFSMSPANETCRSLITSFSLSMIRSSMLKCSQSSATSGSTRAPVMTSTAPGVSPPPS
mmetsp:Transcript_21128/g.66804  ORF Transcript_21128/g.66804 Transcript_21128/m.66804 type:complete len:214 (+) Transcript_21128:41-682(+)